MAEYLNHEAAGTDVCNQKNRIKTHFAKIIVSGTSESRVTTFCISIQRTRNTTLASARIASIMCLSGW